MGFNKLFSANATYTKTVLLDGGLGTTLEDIFHKDIKHPLWSARLVDEDEECIIAAHLAFLHAGSQVIHTSTYQAAYETFRRAKYTDTDAERLMRKSVQLAVEACKRFKQEETTPPGGSKTWSHPQIALSLGPYGATLETAAEFTGKYPPPYGPSRPICGTESASEEKLYENALTAFHYSRLLAYARDTATWDAISIVAFETVPLVTEARAIRRAVALLEDWFSETCQRSSAQPQQRKGMKSWYISFVFPGPQGTFPQYRPKKDPLQTPQDSWPSYNTLDTWRPYTPREVAHAAVSRLNDGVPRMATPDGIGVNCTKVSDILRVIEGFTELVKELLINQTGAFGDEPPWLVLSPNGGLVYDAVKQTWGNTGADSQVVSSGAWARSVWERLPTQNWDHRSTWHGVFHGILLGGCCNTGPDEIRALKDVLLTADKK